MARASIQISIDKSYGADQKFTGNEKEDRLYVFPLRIIDFYIYIKYIYIFYYYSLKRLCLHDCPV